MAAAAAAVGHRRAAEGQGRPHPLAAGGAALVEVRLSVQVVTVAPVEATSAQTTQAAEAQARHLAQQVERVPMVLVLEERAAAVVAARTSRLDGTAEMVELLPAAGVADRAARP